MNVVLTGFMCSGKTSVGKLLSKKLNFTLIDTDTEIETLTKEKIVDIFAKYGEEYFRTIESKVVAEVSKRDKCIISTGGGVVLKKENMDNLRRNGIIVNLKVSPDVVYQRLQNQPGQRPLLNKPNPKEEIEKLLSFREKFYADCDLQIITDELTPEQISDKILEFVKKFNVQ